MSGSPRAATSRGESELGYAGGAPAATRRTRRIGSPAYERQYPRAAVAIVLRDGQSGRLELLLIKRAESGDDPWSGHVALPGGREEASDASLEETALRETLEETGLDVARDGEVLGRLDDLSPRGGSASVIVRPFVVALHAAHAHTHPHPHPHPRLTLSDEVAAAFWLPLDALAAPGAVTESMVQVRGGSLRVASFRHGEYVIWGLTERILQQLLTELAGSTFP